MTALPPDGDAILDAKSEPIQGMTVGQGPTQAEGQSFFEAVGGHETFSRIVHSFYDGVAGDPVLGPMYPANDMDGAVERLTFFLEQY